MKFFYHINRFIESSFIEKKLLVQGILLFIFFFILIKLVPLKYYKSLLYNFSPPKSSSESNLKKVKLVKVTLKRIDRIFRCESCCLIKSLTLKFLFNSIGINSKIELGIMKSANILNAHAYVIADGKHVFLKKNGLFVFEMN